MSGFTKEIIAKTFTELLDEKPMSKITVKDIVERCGVNRNTFYYHFKDIPDVVEFILKKKWDIRRFRFFWFRPAKSYFRLLGDRNRV